VITGMNIWAPLQHGLQNVNLY